MHYIELYISIETLHVVDQDEKIDALIEQWEEERQVKEEIL